MLPLAAGSPFLRTLDLGVEWVHPDAPAAHPLDDGTAVVLERGVEETAAGLGRDGAAYRRLVGPLVEAWDELAPALLGRLPPPPRSALRAIGTVGAGALVRGAGRRSRRAFGDGVAVRDRAGTRVVRGPLRALDAAARAAAERRLRARARGAGSRRRLAVRARRVAVARRRARRQGAGARRLRSRPAAPVDELPAGRSCSRTSSPRELAAARGRAAARSLRAARCARYRHGPGAFKVDWALDGPDPLARRRSAAAPGRCTSAARSTRSPHSEWGAWSGRVVERPFVLLVQPTLFDPTRAPEGKHVAWAYCHVPNGSDVDMTERIEAQVERFAPGFGELVLARSSAGPGRARGAEPQPRRRRHERRRDGSRPGLPAADGEARPLRARRSTASTSARPRRRPGGGVHGMCGYRAARAALEHGS